jgi:hypothetical protein
MIEAYVFWSLPRVRKSLIGGRNLNEKFGEKGDDNHWSNDNDHHRQPDDEPFLSTCSPVIVVE